MGKVFPSFQRAAASSRLLLLFFTTPSPKGAPLKIPAFALKRGYVYFKYFVSKSFNGKGLSK